MNRGLCTNTTDLDAIRIRVRQQRWVATVLRLWRLHCVLCVLIVCVHIHHGRWVLIGAPISSVISTSTVIFVCRQRWLASRHERK